MQQQSFTAFIHLLLATLTGEFGVADILDLLETPFVPTPGSVLAAGLTLPSEYTVSVEVTPTGTIADWGMILSLTQTGNHCCEYGDRLPAIYFHQGNLRIYVAVTRPSGRPGDYSTQIGIPCPASMALQLGQPAQVQVTVSPTSVQVFIDGQLAASNTHADDGRGPLNDVYVTTQNMQGVRVASVSLRHLHVSSTISPAAGACCIIFGHSCIH